MQKIAEFSLFVLIYIYITDLLCVLFFPNFSIELGAVDRVVGGVTAVVLGKQFIKKYNL